MAWMLVGAETMVEPNPDLLAEWKGRGATFQVLEVFRIAQRKGPVLLGKLLGGDLKVGNSLVIQDLHTTVIAIDMPTKKTIAKDTLAVVVSPDLGPCLEPGAELDVLQVTDR